MTSRRTFLASTTASAALAGCATLRADFDLLIRNGTIYDGSGGQPFTGDIAVRGDQIVGIGSVTGLTARHTVDARGLAVAPGFINMLSWATESLIQDGRSQSEIRKGSRSR